MLTRLGAVPRLALGRGHGSKTDAMCGHRLPSIGNRDVMLSRWLRRLAVSGIEIPFLCSTAVPFLRPDLALVGAPRAGKARLAAGGHRARRRGGVTAQ
jgi:hypothetical protein